MVIAHNGETNDVQGLQGTLDCYKNRHATSSDHNGSASATPLHVQRTIMMKYTIPLMNRRLLVPRLTARQAPAEVESKALLSAGPVSNHVYVVQQHRLSLKG
jgi:hypothetical protein